MKRKFKNKKQKHREETRNTFSNATRKPSIVTSPIWSSLLNLTWRSLGSTPAHRHHSASASSVA